MTMHAALPGWYGDGSGTQRWWNGQGWTELLDHGHPRPVRARATLADSDDDDVDVLPRHGVVAPATSLEHGPLRRGREETVRRPFPTFAIVSVSSVTMVTALGFWLISL